jgi:F-type H+-transporting ATPase subunit b
MSAVMKLRKPCMVLLAAALLLAPGAAAIAQTAPATPSAQVARNPKLQAERREEIRQKKIDDPEAEDGANVYRHSAVVHSLANAMGISVEMASRGFMTVNFFLLVVLIVWGLMRLLPRALRARTERIRTEMEQARIATEDANRRLAAVEERLSRMSSEIAAIEAQAAQETEREAERLRASVERERQLILEAANQEIQAATKNAESHLRTLAADLVIDHARRRISVSEEADRSLVAGFVGGLGSGSSANGVRQ